MALRTLVKDGQVFCNGNLRKTNILIEDKKIISLTDKFSDVDEIIDATGLWVLPGLIDTHVHVREPGCEEKEDWKSASRAAAAGGVTTIFDIQNNDPKIKDVADILEIKRCAKKPAVDFGILGVCSSISLPHISEMTDEVVAFKTFMVQSASGSQTAGSKETLSEIFNAVAKTGKILTVHCEDPEIIEKNKQIFDDNIPKNHPKIRSVKAEVSAIKTAIDLAKKHGTRLNIAHVSSREGAKLIISEKEKGMKGLTFEICPHFLFLDKSALTEQGSNAKMNPPLRSKDDCDALLRYLDEEKIDMVTTDHAPHTDELKALSFGKAPGGIIGLETLLPLLLDAVNKKKIRLSSLVKTTSENPARIYGLIGKGKIKEGFDADLVLVDPNLEKTVDSSKGFSKFKHSPFDRRVLKGWPVMTILHGKDIFSGGKVMAGSYGREVIQK